MLKKPLSLPQSTYIQDNTDGCFYLCNLADGHLPEREDSFSGCHEGTLLVLAFHGGGQRE